MKNSLREWGDDLSVMLFYPDPRAERQQRRLAQLQRIEEWLQQLSRWEQRLLPVPFALFLGCLAAWLNLFVPPIDPNYVAFRLWLGP